jgi:hypothetical protein
MYASQEAPDDDLYLNQPDDIAEEYDAPDDDAQPYFGDPDMQRLADVLDFTPHELSANRAGYLTERQIRQLERELRQMYWIIIGILSFTTFGMAALAFVHVALLLIPIGLMIITAMVAYFYRYQRERLPDREVEWSRVKVGLFSLWTNRFFGDNSHQIAYFNNNKLGAPRAVYRAMQPNLHYRVYYAPVRLMPGYRVLTMEPEDSPWKSKRDKAKRE